MKRILIVVVCIVSGMSFSFGQNDWVNQYTQAQEAFNSGNLENAIQ